MADPDQDKPDDKADGATPGGPEDPSPDDIDWENDVHNVGDIPDDELRKVIDSVGDSVQGTDPADLGIPPISVEQIPSLNLACGLLALAEGVDYLDDIRANGFDDALDLKGMLESGQRDMIRLLGRNKVLSVEARRILAQTMGWEPIVTRLRDPSAQAPDRSDLAHERRASTAVAQGIQDLDLDALAIEFMEHYAPEDPEVNVGEFIPPPPPEVPHEGPEEESESLDERDDIPFAIPIAERNANPSTEGDEPPAQEPPKEEESIMPDQNDPNARPDPNAGDDGHEDVAQPEIKLIKVQQVDPKTGKPLNPGDPAQEIDPTGLTDGEISAEKTTLADVVLSTDRFGNMKTPRRRTSRGKNPQGQHFKDERRIKHPLPAIAVKHSANHGAKVLVTAGVLLLAGLLYGQIQKGNSLTEQLTASVNDAKAKATALEAANKATESAQAEAAEAKKQAEAAATPKPLQIVTQKALAARGNLHPPIVTLDKTQVLTDADFPSGSNLGDYFDLGGVTWNSDLAIAVVQYQRRPAYSQLPAALQAKEPGRLVLRKVEVNDGLTTPYRLSGLKMIRDIDGVTAFSVVLEHKSTALVDDDHFQAMGERRLGLLETQPTALADSNVN